MGIHKNGLSGDVGDIDGYITRMADAGLRAAVCVVGDAALAIKVAQAGGIVVFSVDRWRAAPDYNQSPEAAAAERWAGIKALIPPEIKAIEDRVIIEILNEPDQERARFVFAFMLEITKLANADGYIVGGPSWSAGNPYIDAWETDEGLAFLSYCAANRDRAKVLIHEYSLDTQSARTGAPWLIGRFQFVNDILAANEISAVDYIVTEAGWSYDAIPDSSEQVVSDLAWMLETYGDIPFCLWTVGSWDRAPDLPRKLAPYVAPMTDLELLHYEPDEPGDEPMSDWRDEAIQISRALRTATGIRWNPDHGYPRWAVQQPYHYAPTHSEHRFTATDGTVVTVQGFSDLAGEGPDAYLLYTGGWSGMQDVEVITDPDAVPFRSPVGTKEERLSGDIWPGEWTDATGFATRYQIISGGSYHRHTGADLNLNRPSWNADKGMAVHATANGVVTYAERVPSPSTWGRLVVIRHTSPDGDVTHSRYAHMGTMLVQVGQRVLQGDVIGTIGGAEFRLPDHLHFDISHSGILESNPTHWPFDSLTGVLNHYLDPKAVLEGKADALVEPAQLQAGPAGTIGLVGSLQYNAISQYAPYKERALSGIQYIVIHHSAGNPSTPAASIAEGHINRNGGGADGWPGAGYHYYITGDGQIYRINLLETHSFHAGNANGISVGVCLAGSFMNGAVPTDAQLASCRALVDWLKARLPTGVKAMKHRDFMATACPGETWASWWQVATGQEPPGAPEPPTVDLLPYLRGDGRGYMVQHPTGNEEKFRTEINGPFWYQLKNRNYEEFWYGNDFIWRGVDTSPEPGNYYRQFENGQDGARWCPRRMHVGQTWAAPVRHTVQTYRKSDCQPIDHPRNGQATNRVTFVAHHEQLTWNEIQVSDVIELRTGTDESMWFARDYGLVAWGASWGESAIAKILPAHEVDNEREKISCL